MPWGWTNAGAIFHEDVTFILQDKIPDVAWPFMDDCSIKGLVLRSDSTPTFSHTAPSTYTPFYETPDT